MLVPASDALRKERRPGRAAWMRREGGLSQERRIPTGPWAGVSDEGTAHSAARRVPVAGIVKGPLIRPLCTAASTAAPETACRLAGGTLRSKNIQPLRQQNHPAWQAEPCGAKIFPPCGSRIILPGGRNPAEQHIAPAASGQPRASGQYPTTCLSPQRSQYDSSRLSSRSGRPRVRRGECWFST